MHFVWHTCGIAVKRIVGHWCVMARDDLHFRLRLPEDVKAQIEKAAEANRRSMTAEIVSRLEQSLLLPPISIPPDVASRMRVAAEKDLLWAGRQISEDLVRFFPKPPPPKKVISLTTRNMVDSLERSANKTPEMLGFLARLKEQMAAGEIDGDAPAQFGVPLDYESEADDK